MSQPTVNELDWDQLLDFSIHPPHGSLLSPEDITGPVNVSLYQFPSWEQYGYGSLNLSPSEGKSYFEVGNAILLWKLMSQIKSRSLPRHPRTLSVLVQLTTSLLKQPILQLKVRFSIPRLTGRN